MRCLRLLHGEACLAEIHATVSSLFTKGDATSTAGTTLVSGMGDTEGVMGKDDQVLIRTLLLTGGLPHPRQQEGT